MDDHPNLKYQRGGGVRLLDHELPVLLVITFEPVDLTVRPGKIPVHRDIGKGNEFSHRFVLTFELLINGSLKGTGALSVDMNFHEAISWSPNAGAGEPVPAPPKTGHSSSSTSSRPSAVRSAWIVLAINGKAAPEGIPTRREPALREPAGHESRGVLTLLSLLQAWTRRI